MSATIRIVVRPAIARSFDHEPHLFDSGGFQSSERVVENRRTVDFDQGLRPEVRPRPKARADAGGENDCFLHGHLIAVAA